MRNLRSRSCKLAKFERLPPPVILGHTIRNNGEQKICQIRRFNGNEKLLIAISREATTMFCQLITNYLYYSLRCRKSFSRSLCYRDRSWKIVTRRRNSVNSCKFIRTNFIETMLRRIVGKGERGETRCSQRSSYRNLGFARQDPARTSCRKLPDGDFAERRWRSREKSAEKGETRRGARRRRTREDVAL